MSKKTLFALALFVMAAVYGLYRYGQLHPPLKSEPPKAVQLDQAVSSVIEKNLKDKLAALNLTDDQRQRLDAWERFDSKGKTAEQRRAHAEEIKKILSPDQLEQYRAARKEYSQQKRDLRDAREARLKALLGDADYQKNQEDMKRIRARRQERLGQEKKGQTPSVTPTPTGAR